VGSDTIGGVGSAGSTLELDDAVPGLGSPRLRACLSKIDVIVFLMDANPGVEAFWNFWRTNMIARRVARLLLVLSVLLLPLPLSAQSEESVRAEVAGAPQTDAQKRGEAIFSKNCHLCHSSVGSFEQKVELKILQPQLVGLFKKPGVTEEFVRARVQSGLPRRMPSFRLTLSPSEMDDLIAYLRIR